MKRIRAWINDDNELLTVAGVLLVIALVLGIAGHIHDYGTLDLGHLLEDFYANASSEFISIVITVVIIDKLNERRQARREETDLKSRLIREMGSSVHEVAINAVEQLEQTNWLKDGSLNGASFWGTDLNSVTLWHTDLQNTIWGESNLSGSNLLGTNLRGASLLSTDLTGVHLMYADLEGASVFFSDFQNAEMQESNLKDATISRAEFNENTTLPDGTMWTSETDMARFTDPDHPEFWRSDDPNSPAYRGGNE